MALQVATEFPGDASVQWPPVVIDLGTGTCKAGISGENKPKCVIRTIVGTPVSEDQKSLFGDDALQQDGINKTFPIHKGLVTNIDDLEKLLRHIFQDELEIDPSKRPVFLTETPNKHEDVRKQLTKLMFEKFSVPAFYIGNQVNMSLFASGRTAGLVVMIGEGISFIAPVVDGYAVKECVQQFDVTGSDLTDYMTKLLKEKGVDVDAETAKCIKEKVSAVALDYKKQLSAPHDSKVAMFNLPNESVIKLTDERFTCPEALFQPSLAGKKTAGIHKVIYDTIMKCPEKHRNTMFSNVVISGGSSLIPGLPERIQKELDALAKNQVVKVIAPLDEQREMAVWAGASILTSLVAFQSMWIRKSDYETAGTSIIEKC